MLQLKSLHFIVTRYVRYCDKETLNSNKQTNKLHFSSEVTINSQQALATCQQHVHTQWGKIQIHQDPQKIKRKLGG